MEKSKEQKILEYTELAAFHAGKAQEYSNLATRLYRETDGVSTPSRISKKQRDFEMKKAKVLARV